MEEKNNKLRNKIETLYNQEIKEQLYLNNTALISTIDQRFSAFQTVMFQTVKDLVHSLVISTDQNNSNQPPLNTPFTNDHSISSPTHTQSSTIQPSPIIPLQSHLQYNQNTLNSPQLNSPSLLTPR